MPPKRAKSAAKKPAAKKPAARRPVAKRAAVRVPRPSRENAPDAYEVVYADPPWQYAGLGPGPRGEPENHYPTLTPGEIKTFLSDHDIPIAKNAVLYMWTTSPKLIEGLETMKAWGFTYKTQAVWDKQSWSIGWWFRGQHEILLVGTRGRFSPPPTEMRRSSVYSHPRSRHSEKPSEVRDDIKRWFPKRRRIELFARTRSPGWDAFGNELADVNVSAGASEDEDDNDR